MRVVSLLPSATEIVHAVGMGSRLVGRSHECDHPPEVRRLPVLTSARYPSDGPSGVVDRRLRTLLEEGLSVYRVDSVRLEALRPDVIVTQEQCAACAATPADVERAVRSLVGSSPELLSLSASTLEGVWEDIMRVGEALGATARAREAISAARVRVEDVANAAAAAPFRPSVALIEWLDPLMGAGNWMPELAELAGGRATSGEAGAHSPWLEPGRLLAAEPDVVVLVPCGFTLPRTVRELPGILERPPFSELEAVRRGRLYVADGHSYFNRPGPRLVDSLEILAEILHPELFPPSMEGVAWMRVTRNG